MNLKIITMQQISELMELAVKSSELQRHESKPSSDGRFLAAIQSTKIAAVSDLEPIKSALKYCMALVGVRSQNLPDGEEKAVLLNHIIQNYGGHTPDEIRLAFEMAVSGKLGLPLDEVKCYENFSCLYFSTIMNAYREWAKQEYQHVKRPLALPQVDKVTIDLEYAYYLQKQINKLPCKI